VRELSTGWLIVLNGVAWGIIQPGIAYLCTRVPTSAFRAAQWLYRDRPWERGGAIYQSSLRVKRWKDWLPSGGAAFAGGFSMRRMTSHSESYLRRWVQETCRAELTHWLALLASGLFFIWNRPEVGLMMVAYALAANVPCIVVQRHNRPRLLRLLSRLSPSAEEGQRG
jgi:glycosyl-4,4'-diaponeurosporenoate acyltransferase